MPKKERIDSLNIREKLGVPATTRIIDAKVGMHLEVSRADCRKAKNGVEAFRACAGVQSVMRYTGFPALFHRWTALVVGRDADGEIVITRYVIPKITRDKLIARNDDPKAGASPGGFDLRAPNKSIRLDVRRKNDKLRAERVLRGEHKVKRRAKGGGRPHSTSPKWLRTGAGQVHY